MGNHLPPQFEKRSCEIRMLQTPGALIEWSGLQD